MILPPHFSARSLALQPALFAAPMAGLTHSAFRRLLSDWGGTGALFTEMLSARQILQENLETSPALKRRAQEGLVIYQLMVEEVQNLERIIERLATVHPGGLDLNLACHAPAIRQRRAGSGLYADGERLAGILAAMRRAWPGFLSVKIRLGSERPEWEGIFQDRLKLFEDSGVDAIFLHPRFFEDKFKRRARTELYDWAASLTKLPLVANGDITGPESLRASAGHYQRVQGFMVGRQMAVQPWVFAQWSGHPFPEPAEIWRRLFEYILEDFAPAIAISRIKIFTKYFARNFRWGHSFYTAVHNAPTLDEVWEKATAFLDDAPERLSPPSLLGL